MTSQSKVMAPLISTLSGLLISFVIAGPAVANESKYPAITECESQIQKLASVSDQNKKLNQSLDFIWGQWMKEYPEWATYVAYPGQDDRWSDRSMATIQKRKQLPKCHQQLLSKINAKKLNEQGKLTLKLIAKKIKTQLEAIAFPSEFLVVDQLGGVHMDVVDLMMSAPKLTLKDYEDRLARLESFPAYVEQTMALLEEGLKRKITPVINF